MQLIVTANGAARCIYTEAIELIQLGQLAIRRGSHVEPDQNGNWFADLSPVSGPLLGPFSTRTAALAAEVQWLEQHWLVPTDVIHRP